MEASLNITAGKTNQSKGWLSEGWLHQQQGLGTAKNRFVPWKTAGKLLQITRFPLFSLQSSGIRRRSFLTDSNRTVAASLHIAGVSGHGPVSTTDSPRPCELDFHQAHSKQTNPNQNPPATSPKQIHQQLGNPLGNKSNSTAAFKKSPVVRLVDSAPTPNSSFTKTS